MQNGSRADIFLCQTRFLHKSGSQSRFFLLWTRIRFSHANPDQPASLTRVSFSLFYIKIYASHAAVKIDRSDGSRICDLVASAEIGFLRLP